MSFDVGETEQHRVDFVFDQRSGRLAISVDDALRVGQLRMFSLSTVAEWTLEVGAVEKHSVRIEKRRARFLSFARQQPVSAYVDDKLVVQSGT